ncbi:hypothetical protein KUCAC02_008460, partial [Chaenocephalus aceratus]
ACAKLKTKPSAPTNPLPPPRVITPTVPRATRAATQPSSLLERDWPVSASGLHVSELGRCSREQHGAARWRNPLDL